MKQLALAGLMIACGLGACGWADGADWPMWRCDARHSAASPAELPASLVLHWTRKLPATIPAWPNEPRLHFDVHYEPIVSGHRLILGSPNEGSVSAWDTRSGQPLWHYYTNGPVRFAPVARADRVLAASDDGEVHCLALANGQLLWKTRIAPADRPDRRHLGNGRLISAWPVRGGPVLEGNTLYCAAGVWPTLGVFVAALDIRNGNTLWRNDQLGFLPEVRLDHNELGPSALSPQGYLALEGNLLLVPNGRSLPALLDRHTGKLQHYLQGYRNGDCRVTVAGRYAFVGAAGVVDLTTGREVGSRWLAAGADAPAKFDGARAHLFEGPIHAYKQFPGCSWRSVLSDGMAYDFYQGVLTAYDLAQAQVTEYEAQMMERTLRPWRWEVPQQWKFATELAAHKPSSAAVIRCGNRLYAHMADTLLAVELPAAGASARVAWQQSLPGKPGTLLAADNRLFAITGEGAITCLGSQAEGNQAQRFPLQPKPLPSPDDWWSKEAAELLKLTDPREGYCVLLGLGRGRLAAELLRQEPRLKLIAVDRDPQKVNAFRDALSAAGWYGTRAEALAGDPGTFPFPPYLAGLLIAGDGETAGLRSAPVIGKLFERLRPYGGTLCLPLYPNEHGVLERAAAGLPGAKLERSGRWSLLRRTGPLPESAVWTHECADAARSYFSRDRLVRPPFGVLWYGDGPDYGFWKEKDYGTGVKPQVIGGRLFALQISSNTLVAYDVYTGRQLWKTATTPFTRYASLADGIYVAGGNRCTVYDPASGKKTADFPFAAQPGGKDFVADIRVSEQVVLIATAAAKVREIEKGLWDSTALVALDRRSGKTLWSFRARERFNNHALALGGGLALCVDSLSPQKLNEALRRGDSGPLPAAEVIALDERTGKQRWRVALAYAMPKRGLSSWLSIRGNDDWLAYAESAGLILCGKFQKACALEAATGKQVWQRDLGAQPMILCGDTFFNQASERFELRSGRSLGATMKIQKGGCNYLVANPACLFLRDRSASYIDLESRREQSLYAVRSGCSNSLIAADGLLNVPNFAVGCVCNYPIQTCFALMHSPEAAAWLTTGDTP